MIQKHHYTDRKSFLSLRNTIQYPKDGTIRIGGSEIGTVMQLNPYQSNVELFAELIGLRTINWDTSINALRGIYLEKSSVLYHYWKHTDPEYPITSVRDQDAIIAFVKRMEAGKVVRKGRAVNNIAINSKYPWLFASLDYEIFSGHGKASTGVLEMKSPRNQSLNMYENGLPESNIVQIMGQMLVTGRTWGELMQLVDATYPLTTAFQIDEAVCENIIEQTREFCNLATKARDIVISMTDKGYAPNDIEAATEHLFPVCNEPALYEQYLKSQYRAANRKLEIVGTASEHKTILSAKRILSRIGELENHAISLKNKIKERLIKEGADTMIFEDGSKITDKGNGFRFYAAK